MSQIGPKENEIMLQMFQTDSWRDRLITKELQQSKASKKKKKLFCMLKQKANWP